MLSPATHTAEDVIRLLALAPLPHEGGWFRRTAAGKSAQDGGAAPWSMIHALFTPAAFSALHRVTADEIWCFQTGDALDFVQLDPASGGRGERFTLGGNSGAGERWQHVVPGGNWQGARLVPGGRWALVTCVVVPEFRWQDFELGRREELIRDFPAWAATIRELTRLPASED